MFPKLPPSAVRDNYNDDEEDEEDELSDVDDEVFIRDGKSGILKIEDDCADKRPLMPPRRKAKSDYRMDAQAMPYRVLFAPFCYGALAIFIVLSLIVLGIFTMNILFPMPLSILRKWAPLRTRQTIFEQNFSKSEDIVACTSLAYDVVWKKTLPKFAAEAPLRSSDVNGDNVEDIIVGFSIGLEMFDSAPEFVCTMYFGGQTPCLGGVVALDGETGETIWTHWTAHAVFSVDCGLDLTNDLVKDCVISGRGGILHAINGHDGSILWETPLTILEQEKGSTDVYDAKYIADVDGDQVGDVVASHILEAGEARNSRIILISGKSGSIISSVDLPDTEQLFVAPQTLVQPDGENIFVLSTNSQQKSGGLYIVSQANILRGEMKLRKLHHGPGKGVSLPPILADVTSDGTEDIIAAMFSSSVVAFDGITFHQLWNYTVPDAEIISIPIPGYYNDDDVPDFMVRHQIGPGFPVYYYTLATILDGKTGKPLLEHPIEDTMGGQMSGLSLSVEGFGNDWFLYWSADCLHHEGARAKYQFVEPVEGQNAKTKSRADLCKLRFNSTLTTKLYAMSQHVGPPGISLYDSRSWRDVELANFVDPRQEAEQFIARSAQQMHQVENKKQHFYPQGREPADYELGDDLDLGRKMADDVLGVDDKWQNAREADKIYDALYEEDDAGGTWSNEARAQRSGSMKHLDYSNMDYTNGQKVSNETELDHFEELDESDFVDPEVDLDLEVKKREVYKTYEDYNATMAEREDAKIEKIFKRESMKNLKGGKRSRRNSDLADGVQRQPPTGILLPSRGARSVDLAFSTYWLPSSQVPFVLLQQDLDCIRDMKAELVNAPRRNERLIMKECLANRGIDFKVYQEALDKENTKIALGQMTVYRMSIRCVCPEDTLLGQSCKNVSARQSWPGHLGASGNGFFRPLGTS